LPIFRAVREEEFSMRRSFVILVVVCALAAACGGKGNPTEPSSSNGPSSSSSSSTPASPTASGGPGPGNPGNTEVEIKGAIEALPPATAPLTFRVAGRNVLTTASTLFKDGSLTRTFADLRVGMRVEAKGTSSGDTITATQVEIEDENENEPDEAEIEGVVSELSGSAASFQFKIGSRVVKGDANTVFVGESNTPASFADLKNGVDVEVKGTQQAGFVQAARIHLEDDDDDAPRQPPQNPEAEITGRLNAIAGSAPTLTLTVNTTTVRTTAATTVRRRGDPVTFAALQVGQTLEVEGTRRTDGSIDAQKITIEDDENENEENEVRAEGTMSGKTGSCPAITFTVGSLVFTTNASTRFDNACTSFVNGDRVEARGNRSSNGTVIATRLRKRS
jgi:Domain of unknown function (DUF5666)